jgi:hypothetical protein
MTRKVRIEGGTKQFLSELDAAYAAGDVSDAFVFKATAFVAAMNVDLDGDGISESAQGSFEFTCRPQGNTHGHGAGGGAGKATFQDLTFTKDTGAVEPSAVIAALEAQGFGFDRVNGPDSAGARAVPPLEDFSLRSMGNSDAVGLLDVDMLLF